MNEVEEYYLQHFGVKGMKWGRRKSRNSSRSAKKQTTKANKALYKEAKKDNRQLNRAKNSHNATLASKANQNIERKRAANKDYDKAYAKAKKANDRTYAALQVGAIANTALAVAMVNNPSAVNKGANVVASVLGKGASRASTAGIYVKYAAKAAVPVSRTVKNRGVVDAILVNSGNALKVVG